MPGLVKPTAPSAYWGDRQLWDTRFNTHNAMFGKDGRVWFSASIRGRDNPAWCKKGSDNQSAKVIPDRQEQPPGRGATIPRPGSSRSSILASAPTICSSATTIDDTLWLSGTGQVAGWIDTKVFDETHNSQKSVGWAPFVLDLNGNGKLDDVRPASRRRARTCTSIRAPVPTR